MVLNPRQAHYLALWLLSVFVYLTERVERTFFISSKWINNVVAVIQDGDEEE